MLIIMMMIIISIYVLPRCRRPIVGWYEWCAGELLEVVLAYWLTRG